MNFDIIRRYKSARSRGLKSNIWLRNRDENKGVYAVFNFLRKFPFKLMFAYYLQIYKPLEAINFSAAWEQF